MVFGSDDVVTTTFRAKDELSRSVTGMRGRFAQFKRDAVAGFGLGAGIGAFNLLARGVGAVTDLVGDAIKAAADEERGIAQLTTAIQANDKAWDGNMDAIEAVINAREDLAFADDAQRESLAQLVAMVQDTNQALDLQAIAMDLARGKQMDLVTATTLIGKVATGNISILKRYGITIRDGVDATEALAEISRRYAGQAKAFASTTAGQMERAQIEISNAMEELGALLTPVVADLARMAADTIPAVVSALGNLGDAFNDVNRFFNPHVAAVQDLDEALRVEAEARGLDADTLLEWTKRQREAQQAAEDARRLEEDLAYEIELNTLRLQNLGLSEEEARREAEAMAQAQRDLAAAQSETADTTGDLTAEVDRLVTEWLQAGGIFSDPAVIDALSGLADAFGALEDEAGVSTAGTADRMRAFQRHLRTTLHQASKDVLDLPPTFREAFQQIRSEARVFAANLEWEIKHPWARSRLVNWLDKELDRVNKLLHRKDVQRNKDARADARTYREWIIGEMSKLRGFHMDINTTFTRLLASGPPPTPPARAHGGPVEAGRPYLVGEYGAELFVPRQSGSIEPGGGHGHAIVMDGRVIGQLIDRRMGRALQAAPQSAATNW